jgi:hypothetical protein
MNFSALQIVNGDLGPGPIHKQPFARAVILTHDQIAFAFPALIVIAKTTVEVTVPDGPLDTPPIATAAWCVCAAAASVHLLGTRILVTTLSEWQRFVRRLLSISLMRNKPLHLKPNDCRAYNPSAK